jgi:hypothetical protein
MSETKTNLKARLAAVRESKTSANKEAKTRVASAWTLAKSLLPTAPTEIQFKMASALLANGTQALTAALRQTAVNAHYTKVAEKFEQIHKVELNEFLEDESLLKKLKGEVEKELKGEAKNAKSKAASECVCAGAGCENCAKTAAPEDEMPPVEEGVETEEVPSDLPPVDDAEMGEELPPVEDGMGEDLPPVGDEGSAIPPEVKEELQGKIDNLEADVAALEEAIEGEEELDFSKIFDEGDMEDKTDSLANEGEGDEFGAGDEFGVEGEEEGFDVEADGGASFFSDAEALEGQLDDNTGTTDPSEFFHSASRHDVASMDSLLADGKTAGKEVVERGEWAKDLMNEGGVPDAEEDHDDVILYEVLQTIKPEKYDPGTKREGEPKLEKAATAAKPSAKVAHDANQARKEKTLRSLGTVKVAATQSKDQAMLSALVFPDQEW